ARLMRFGAAQLMKQRPPASEEARVVQPDWAASAIEGIQRDIVGAIRRSGVRIVGDLDRLIEPAAPAAPRKARRSKSPAPPADEILVRPDAAAAMAMGILVAAGEARPDRARFEIAEPVELLDVPTYQLAATVLLRTWRTGVRTVERIVNRLKRPFAGAPPLVEP